MSESSGPVGSIAPEPYCQPARPFSFVPPQSLLTTFVAPLPDGHPERTFLAWSGVHDVSVYAPAKLAERVAIERTSSVDFAVSARILRDWFTDHDPSLPLHGNVVTLTRILSVIAAVTLPGRCPGDLYLDFALWAQPRLVLPPGGNLSTLVWLGWRYVHGYAVALELLQSKVASEPDLHLALATAFDFVRAGGTAPAHDPIESADRGLADDAVFFWPDEYSRYDRLVRRRVRRLQLGADRGAGGRRHGVRRDPFAFVPFPDSQPGGRVVSPDLPAIARERGQYSLRNYLWYANAAGVVFEAVLDLLQCVGHFTALLRRFICPYEPRIGLAHGPGPVEDVKALRRFLARMCTWLRPVKELDASLLDGHFVESAKHLDVSPEYWSMLEGNMLEWVNHAAPLAVTTAWGVLPGEPDSFQRAGPRCMPTHCGVVFPTEYYADAPSPDAVLVERPGSWSFSERYRGAQEARARSPALAPPQNRARDAFVWDDLHHEDIGRPIPV